MNYAEARQTKDGAGWHFTVRNDDQVWPHECCRTEVPATEDDVARLDWIYHGRLKVGDLIAGPAHEPHATREEAEECFHQWRLRQPVELTDSLHADWTGCVVCDAPTKGGARVRDIGGPTYHSLCDDHRTEDVVRERTGRITASVYS